MKATSFSCKEYMLLEIPEEVSIRIVYNRESSY